MQNVVRETSFGEDLAHIVGILHNLRVAHGYSSLDRSGLALHAKPQPLGGVSVHLSGRLIFGFDDHRGSARRDDQHVGMAARMIDEGLGVLRADLTARHHAPQQVAQ